MQTARQREKSAAETEPMLRSLKEIHGYAVRATDRDLGKIHDTYFEDKNWVVQYFVVDTGEWLPGRKVVLSPASFGRPDWGNKVVPTNLTSEKVKNSPAADLARPISQEMVLHMNRYYGWPARWSGLVEPAFAVPVAEPQETDPETPSRDRGSSGLRSATEVLGYNIDAKDGAIGHVEDFIIEERSWVIRYLIIDTRNWLPGGRKVLITPSWAKAIDWGGRSVSFELDREAIRNSPEFDPTQPINRTYELQLYDYYGRPCYWKTGGAS